MPPHLTRKEGEGPRQLLLMCFQESVNIASSLMKLLKRSATFVLKFVHQNKLVLGYIAFSSCALLMVHHLAKRFGKKLKRYHYLTFLFLLLLIVLLLTAVIKAEAFQTILDWLTSILVSLFVRLQHISSLLDRYDSESTFMVEENLEPSKVTNTDFKTLTVFSILMVITARYLLGRFKRELVGDSPLTEVIIKIVDKNGVLKPAY